jgi:hypothetical protein
MRGVLVVLGVGGMFLLWFQSGHWADTAFWRAASVLCKWLI